MSETLPPMTGTGVCINFIFPFDRELPRNACVVWRRTIGDHQNVDTKYAEITQSGDSAVVHEQITFPGDCWAAVAEGVTLALHVATAEREQRVAVTRASRAAAAQAAATPVTRARPDSAQHHAGDDDSSDPELAAAIRASLQTAADEIIGAQEQLPLATAGRPSPPIGRHLPEALALSKRLADEYRQSASAGRTTLTDGLAQDSIVADRRPADAEEMRAARLRRFGAMG